MLAFIKGKYRVRSAATPVDLRLALELRSLVFSSDRTSATDLDTDRFDEFCEHVLIEERSTNRSVCCFRMLFLDSGTDIDQSYSSQYYDLSALRSFTGPMLEIGRFCVDPDVNDPDVLRLAWGALAGVVDGYGVDLLFGCSSFEGTDAEPYADAFAILRDHHLAPNRWLPRAKAPKIVEFTKRLRRNENTSSGKRLMPPLLKTYLLMGGWVSDHAVIDSHTNTLHVFTGVEIKGIPAGRKRLLRAVTAGAA